MEPRTIGFIGGGNMARSLIGGLIAAGVSADTLWVTDPVADIREALAADFGIHAGDDNQVLVDACDVVVLAVKPQVLEAVATAIHPSRADQLFLTIAAGIRTAALARWLGGTASIVRAMPNTPALVQSAATGMYAGPDVSAAQRNAAESIMRAAGLVQWVDDEALMDAVTALSGSGPAYFFLIMEALEQAGQALGLPAATARLLTVQTAFGAARLALEIEEDPAQLRRNVTSPGGTTQEALRVLMAEEGLQPLLTKAIAAATARSRELG